MNDVNVRQQLQEIMGESLMFHMRAKITPSLVETLQNDIKQKLPFADIYCEAWRDFSITCHAIIEPDVKIIIQYLPHVYHYPDHYEDDIQGLLLE